MNNDDRKLLTEFLGECWHNKTIYFTEEGIECGDICSKCNLRGDDYDGQLRQRTFTTAQDMVDLARKMVEKGVWEGFMRYSDNMFIASMPRDTWEELFAWLITNPERFCQLCYDSEVWR